MKPRHRRLLAIAGGVAALGLATTFVLNAFRDNLVFFFSPTQVLAEQAPKGRSFRIGGLVEPGTITRSSDGLTVLFNVTDSAKSVRVIYNGILPDLFREGKGVVAQGRLNSAGTFHATEVLAKHDENYMPPEAAHALEQARHATPVGNRAP